MRQSDLDFLALLPDSISTDPTFMALAEAVGGELRRAGQDLPLSTVYSRLNELTEPVLSLLAWQLNVLWWDEGLDDATKRELIRQAIPWRRIHGTAACVEQAVGTVCGGGCTVVPWWEFGGEPGRFRLEVELADGGLNDVRHRRMLSIARRTKNARSHLDAEAVRLGREAAVPVRVGATLLQAVRVRYLPAMPGADAAGSAAVHVGAGVTACMEVRTTPAVMPD